MLNKQQFILLSSLGSIALVLSIITIVLFNGNRSAQNEFRTRTQFIQQSLQLEPEG